MYIFLNNQTTPQTYTLSLHDALPICQADGEPGSVQELVDTAIKISAFGQDSARELYIVDHVGGMLHRLVPKDRKSTRLNSSHSQISYAVFCLKKKKNKTKDVIIYEKI